MTYKLSETSALVLLCEKGANYQTPKSKLFLSQLDISSGKNIYNQYSRYFSEITRIINNRKYIIHKCCSDFLRKHGPSAQLIFLACGWDPVLIKMQELFPKNKLFGIDNDVEEIKNLADKIFPESCISYLEGDITQHEILLKNLLQNKWNPSQPTGLVVEGINYYITPSSFWTMISSIKKSCQSHFFMCGDFLFPLNEKYVSKKGMEMGRLIFDTIKEQCQIEKYHSCSPENFNKRILNLGLNSVSFINFEDVELQRFGKVENWKKGDCHVLFFSTPLSSY